MAKPIRKLPGMWAEPELTRCVEKAGRAAGAKSILTDGDILLLAELAWSGGSNLERRPNFDEDRERPTIEASPEYIERTTASLVRIMARDSEAAARALIAAHKEAKRIRMTEIWCVRAVLRHTALILAISRASKGKVRAPNWDIQEIRERVKKSSGFSKTTSATIHKAIRLEIETQKMRYSRTAE